MEKSSKDWIEFAYNRPAIFIETSELNTFRYIVSKPELKNKMFEFSKKEPTEWKYRIETFIKGFDAGYLDEIKKNIDVNMFRKGVAYKTGYALGRADAKKVIEEVYDIYE